MGQIRIEGSVLTGNITKTLARMAKERRALNWITKELHNHRAEHAGEDIEQIAISTDTKLLTEHATALAKQGKFTKYIKIVHSAVATNNIMARRNNANSGLCPCCEKKPETLHHLMAECEANPPAGGRGETGPARAPDKKAAEGGNGSGGRAKTY